LYVDDGVLASPNAEHLDEAINKLQGRFKITEEKGINDYVGINIERINDNVLKMTQPQLIQSIMKELNSTNDTKVARTPAMTSKILTAGKKNPKHKADWLYRRIIGKLNFLEKSVRPDISCAAHNVARFSEDPRLNHTEAVTRIVRYLKGTSEDVIIFAPTQHSFEVWVDADFCGLWNRDTAIDDPATAKSRTGLVVTYAGCPITWASQLQTEVAQSTTEAEYIALSTALRSTIPIMRLVREIN
jgi:hypothetical protein